MKKYILPILLAVLTTGCNLDYAPENTLVDETVYKNANTADAAVLGAYNLFNVAVTGAPSGTNNYATTGIPYLFAEIGTPTLASRPNSSYLGMETAQYTSADHEGYIRESWTRLYAAIDYANNIIKNVKKFGQYDAALMAQHIGEAKVLRAYSYLTLLVMYGDGALTGNLSGDGVVMRLDPYEGYNPGDAQTRITVGETYNQILKDLKESLRLLPDRSVGSTITGRTRIMKTTAFALLSRVYLYRGTYDNVTADLTLAGAYADSVLDIASARGYTFSSSANHLTNNMFPKNPTDAETNPTDCGASVIFLEPSYSLGNKYANGLGYVYFDKGNFYVDRVFQHSYPAKDVRGVGDTTAGAKPACLIWQGSASMYPKDSTSAKYNNANGYNSVIYIRLEEVKLTKAEVAARLGGINDVSLGHLNDIYRRPFVASSSKPVAYTSSSFASGAVFVDRILVERMRELAFEGHTRFDLIRTNKSLRVSSLPNNKKNLPIPDYDIQISSGKLIQNSGFR